MWVAVWSDAPGAGAFVAAKFGEAEVENFYLAGLGDENVFGLEVAVDDAAIVSGGEAVGELHGEFDGFADGKAGGGDAFAQGFAFEEFGDDEVDAAGFADVEDGDDVGMIERGDGAGFLFEAAQAVGVVGEGGGKNF